MTLRIPAFQALLVQAGAVLPCAALAVALESLGHGLTLLQAALLQGLLAAAILAIAEATAGALTQVGNAIQQPGGETAMNLKVAEQYVEAFGQLAKTNNSLIVPANVGEMSSLIATALQVVKTQK